MNAAKVVEICGGSALTEEMADQLIYDTEPKNHDAFFKECGGCATDKAVDAVDKIAHAFVKKWLNCADQTLMPIRRKSKLLIVLNNFVQGKKMQPHRMSVLTAIGEMDSIFEESMKREGNMPFDSELGRMSEHVLVLLMRVLNYKMKAPQVLEFAENNTQFAVQLLLAVLLAAKPDNPYEEELRINCITCLLGFTVPHAFFSASDKIEETSCGKFGEKVDFIANLMLRLSALQVVNDVLTPHLLNVTSGQVPPLIHIGATHMMRCSMNIFQFAATSGTKWRQHILVSTSFVDGCTILYLQAQVRHLETLFSKSGQLTSSVPTDLLGGITTALRFMSFACWRLGKYARCIRPLCHFIPELCDTGFVTLLSPEHAAQSRAGAGAADVIVSMLHFLSNIDALAGDDEIIAEEGEDALADDLTSSALQAMVSKLAGNLVAVAGPAALEGIKGKFNKVKPDSLVSSDTASFSAIAACLSSATPTDANSAAASGGASGADRSKQQAAAQAAHAQSSAGKKVATDDAGNVDVDHKSAVASNVLLSAPNQTGEGRFLCALNQHTMKNPVTSPYGHFFDKEVIEQWLKQRGTCPFTGKPLKVADLKPNKELQAEIMQSMVMQSMQSNTYDAGDDADLYDF